jgi:hypothetical protein
MIKTRGRKSRDTVSLIEQSIQTCIFSYYELTRPIENILYSNNEKPFQFWASLYLLLAVKTKKGHFFIYLFISYTCKDWGSFFSSVSSVPLLCLLSYLSHLSSTSFLSIFHWCPYNSPPFSSPPYNSSPYSSAPYSSPPLHLATLQFATITSRHRYISTPLHLATITFRQYYTGKSNSSLASKRIFLFNFIIHSEKNVKCGWWSSMKIK